MEKYSRPSTVPASLRCGGTWLWRAFWRLRCDPHSARLLVVPSVAVAGSTHPGQKKKEEEKRKKNQTRQSTYSYRSAAHKSRGPLPAAQVGTAPKYPYHQTGTVLQVLVQCGKEPWADWQVREKKKTLAQVPRRLHGVHHRLGTSRLAHSAYHLVPTALLPTVPPPMP